jgi:hypothetical protein
MADWIGNKNTAYAIISASNHSDKERAVNDYYATDPKAIDYLLDDGGAEISHKILEPACGEGHLSERLKAKGFDVKSSDLIDRGYGEQKDFFGIKKWDGDIVTNPPYKYAKEFVEHALCIIPKGRKAFMFLKLTFLEGKGRREFFRKYPPKIIYVSSGRITCAPNGEFEKTKKEMGSSAVAYAWFEWENGWKGEPRIKWIN